MENLSKETLLKIIDDLNQQFKQSYNHENKITGQIEELKEEITKLQDENNDIQSQYDERCSGLEISNESLKNKNESLKNKLSEILSDDSSSECSMKSSCNMTKKQKANMIKFLKEKCIWTSETLIINDINGIYEVAISSARDIHRHLREWAIEKNIKTKGKCRGIPIYDEFRRYIVYRQKRKYSNLKWRCSEINQYPKFYNGSNSTPRINLKFIG